MRDVDEIVRLEGEFLAAWNRGDARGAAAVFAEDGRRVGAFGDVQVGREQVRAAYEQLLHGLMKGATAECQVEVRLLSGDLAVAQGPLTIRPAGGGAPRVGYAMDLWRKIAGGWQIVEAHPKLFPPRG